MPDNDIRVPAFSTPERIFGFYLQSMEQPSISSRGSSAEIPESGRNAPHSNLSRAASLDDLPGGGLNLDSSPSVRGKQSRVRQTPGPVDVTNANDARNKYFGADETPPGLDETTEPLGHRTTNLKSPSEQKSVSLVDNNDWSHETQLISTEPAVATHRLGPRAPQHLEALAATMDMRRRYQPKYQARAMMPFERGYWLLRLDGWKFEQKVQTWGFLGNYIRREDKAG
ncbi:hypothetical protein diail_11041, partial [Diaporthe ilicicola]